VDRAHIGVTLEETADPRRKVGRVRQHVESAFHALDDGLHFRQEFLAPFAQAQAIGQAVEELHAELSFEQPNF
jgi:hypothetical protein